MRSFFKNRIGILNIAHRGARAYAPENTLAAFKKAKSLGRQMFECDVHLTKDGEIIVYHDDQLSRCTDAQKVFPDRSSYFVSDFNFDELSRLDAGSWYIEELKKTPNRRQSFLQTLKDDEFEKYISSKDLDFYTSGEIKIPTLRQALEFAKTEAMQINIEIKNLPRMYLGLTEAVVRLVQEMGMEKDVLISSFDHEQLVKIRHLTQTIATAVLTTDRLARLEDYLSLIDADAYHPGCYGDYDSLGLNSIEGQIDPRGFDALLKQGFAVHAWTCNEKDQMLQLINAGIKGIMTDYPNRMQEILRKL